MRDEVANAERAINVSKLLGASSFVDVVRFLVRTALRSGFYALFDVRFVHVGERDMLELRRGYSLQGKVGTKSGVSDTKYLIAKLLSNWLGTKNTTVETELLFWIEEKVNTAFKESSPEEQSSLSNVIGGMLNVSASDWTAAVNDAHGMDALRLQASDTVIDTDMASVRVACAAPVEKGANATAFYMATNLMADVIFAVYSKLHMKASPLQQAGFCMYMVRMCLTVTWPLLTAELLLDRDNVPALEQIFTSLKQAAKTSKALTWMDDAERDVAAGIFGNTTLLVVSPTMTVNPKINYTGPSKTFEQDPSKFLLTYVRARSHHCDVMLRSPPTRAELMMADMETSARVAYLPHVHTILIPTLQQSRPYLYSSGVPDYYNYGTVGGLMATRLIEALVMADHAWSKASKTKRGKVISCLAERHKRQGFGRKVSGEVRAQQVLMLSLSAGVRLAYAAMESHFRERMENNEKLIQKFWPAAQETFFTRFCLLWCSASKDPVTLTFKEMCLLPLYNMKEFGERYGCKSNSNFSAGPMCDV
ncbi:endothelin-converting enzyme 2-like [Dermacentor variabilis]|uniref:endothelin-converting enzyme 2-like n=1 Tax=Dermacentor variabilis TaxID=34621 RepID=UPI003F5C8C9D